MSDDGVCSLHARCDSFVLCLQRRMYEAVENGGPDEVRALLDSGRSENLILLQSSVSPLC